MRHVKGAYTQAFNQRHVLLGHLFQGRFKAILVDRDAYLLALCRYVERNPVDAGLVGAAEKWPWSSECGFTMTALAKELGLSVSRVSRLIAAADRVAQEKSNS